MATKKRTSKKVSKVIEVPLGTYRSFTIIVSENCCTGKYYGDLTGIPNVTVLLGVYGSPEKAIEALQKELDYWANKYGF